MPDWSYQTLFRPLLFRLPAAHARDITLRAMGTLTMLSGRVRTIELFGDMEPPAGVHRSAWGIDFPSPVGVGAGLDVHAVALPALAQCGIGFLEVGPVTRDPLPEGPIHRRTPDEAIHYAAPLANDGVDVWAARLAQYTPLRVPLGIRLAHRPGADPDAAADECGALAARLAPYADFLTLDTRSGSAGGWQPDDWEVYLARVTETIQRAAPDIPLLLCLPPDLDTTTVDHLLAVSDIRGLAGIVIGGGVAQVDGGRLMGPSTFTDSVRLVGTIHRRYGERFTIIGSGGIREPADALAMLAAGATFVQLHSGLVYAGPALPKRINASVIASEERTSPSLVASPAISLAQLQFGWLWIALLGFGILLAGILAWLVAATRVILPYDEWFLGIRRGDLMAANGDLLAFMTHDRITFAGAMIALGVVYVQYAFVAMRQGIVWARRAALISCGLGFLGFFLFLGFRYLDPLHAITTAPLFVFFLLALFKRPSSVGMPFSAVPDLHNDRRWRIGLWGQLLFVTVGFGMFVAGFTIAMVGITTLFVPTDLAFMHTSRDALASVNPRLIPLLAHDRASFGGTLAAVGVGWLLGAMWGFQRGARWLWWTFVVSGIPGFLTTLGVHLAVGYTAFEHLAPVYLAMTLYVLALALSYPYLCMRAPVAVPSTSASAAVAMVAVQPPPYAATRDSHS